MRSSTLCLLPMLLCLSGCSGKAVRSSDAASAGGGTTSVAEGPSPARPPVLLAGSIKVNRYELSNGLRLLVIEDHSSPTFAYQTWFRVGSKDEIPGRTGLAHLFEHMMFKETKNLKDGEFDKILEANGAEGENAFTSRDYTAYVQEMPSDKLELLARLEAERMVNLVVDEKAFKTETEVVQNERRYRNENSPDGMMHQELYSEAFSKSPYHWPVIGYQEDLNAMSGQDAMNFYKTYYSPAYATVAVVGDVDPEKTFEIVKKHYGGIPAQAPPMRELEQEPAQTSPRRKVLKLNVQIEKLEMGYHVPKFSEQDYAVLDVVQAILSGGKSSRLLRALVDTGIASGVEAYNAEAKEPSLFVVSVNLQKKKKAAQAEAVVLREIERLAKEKVPEKELERARNRLDYLFYESLNSNMDLAHFVGKFETIGGDFMFAVQQYNRSRAVTPEEIQAVVKKHLRPSNRTVITGVPK